MTYMKDLGMPIIIHAYYLRADDFYKPKVYEVPDVNWTDEYRLLTLPKSVYRSNFEITEFETARIIDVNGVEAEFVTDVQLKPVKFQNYGEDLLEIMKRKVC